MNADEPGDQAAEPAARTHTRRLRWWVSGITLVAGFVLGVLAVGLLSLTTPDFAAGTGPGGGGNGSAATVAPNPGGSIPVVAEARVNAACLAVINEAQDMYVVLTGLGQAVTDVNLQQLDDTVRRLQPIEARLGEDLQKCEVDTGIGTNPTGSAAPDPGPSPSATATR
jgi:hypothetical protein